MSRLYRILQGVKGYKPAWASNLKVGDHIPKELLDELPVTTGRIGNTWELDADQKYLSF